MDGTTIEDFVMKGSSSFIEDSCGDSVVENGTSSTSSSYEDTDNDADDCGTKPSALYNKFTWTIENFSKVDKRELRSEQYDAGGYKWYILIYPQGCDVSNHLSLFLCVANHDKFLPGWSHFAQFTIAVVNKDPNKSKYSDTLHRFWKKEHDWGWKKFMELSKLSDGFINADTDTLVINAQVQVIRENTHRPFRCLDREYRRELVRVYSSNVEQICWRFFEERRGRLSKLIEDKLRWSSFRAFWLGINQNVRRCMSRDTTEAILKAVVKHFFIEKEVTSTLVMDSLYYGLKALEGRIRDRRSGPKLESMDESPVPMVCIEKDMFVLADDVLLLLERAAMVRHQPLLLKDEKASQNRTKDGNFGEQLNKVIIQRDERRFTELGRRTLELFILVHIFSSRIEIAYNEAVALKRQEELIREEEAAGQVENELRAKRLAADKEKRTKKKQAKQKRNTRKGKDKGRDDKPDTAMQDKHQTSGPSNGRISDSSSILEKLTVEKIATVEEASDVSDAGDDAPEAPKPESDNRDVNQDAKTLEVRLDVGHEIQNREVEREKRSPSPIIDDSCSTCSTDSASSVTINGAYNRNSSPKNKGRTSSMRVKNHTLDQICDARGGKKPSPEYANVDNSTVARPEPETVVPSPKNLMQGFRQNSAKEEVEPLQKASTFRDRVQVDLFSKSRTVESSPSLPSPARKPPSALQQTKKSNATASTTTTTTTTTTAAAAAASVTPTSATTASASATTTPASATTHEPASSPPSQTEKSLSLAAKSPTTTKSEAQKLSTPSIPRPSSAPLVPSPRTTAPAASTVQALPLLSRSMSSAGRLDTDPSPSPSALSFIFRNPLPSRTSDFTPLACSTSLSQPLSYSQAPSPLLPLQSSMRIHHPPSNPRYAFVPAMPESLRAKQHMGEVSDEFPHIGIINDLLDEDQTVGGRSQQHRHRPFERQYTFPRDVGSSDGTCRLDRSYGEVSQRPDRFSVGPLQVVREPRTVQMEPSVYAGGRIDGIHRSQWPYRASMLNSGGDDADGYPYQLMDYGNGYSMF